MINFYWSGNSRLRPSDPISHVIFDMDFTAFTHPWGF